MLCIEHLKYKKNIQYSTINAQCSTASRSLSYALVRDALTNSGNDGYNLRGEYANPQCNADAGQLIIEHSKNRKNVQYSTINVQCSTALRSIPAECYQLFHKPVADLPGKYRLTVYLFIAASLLYTSS